MKFILVIAVLHIVLGLEGAKGATFEECMDQPGTIEDDKSSGRFRKVDPSTLPVQFAEGSLADFRTALRQQIKSCEAQNLGQTFVVDGT